MDCERVTSVQFKDVLDMYGFDIKKTAKSRAQIQAIKLKVNEVKKPFDNDNKFEE